MQRDLTRGYFPCLPAEIGGELIEGRRRTFYGSCVCEALRIMIKFLLWCILLVLCWPLALVALVLYPLVWLMLLPFRVAGIAVGGALALVSAIIFLPVRVLKAI